MLDWSESAPAFKIAKQSSCLCIPFPFSNSHLAKNSLPREAFQATLGTGFEIFTICVKMHFSCSLQFPILSWNGFVARPKYYIHKWKIPTQLNFTQHSETVFPFSAQQKCLPAANLDLFWLWILFERNFYHQWSSDSVHALEINHLFSRGLWQGGAHTVLCTWISMSSDQSSQTGRPATRPVSGWAAPSRWSTLEDTIVTGARAIDCKL